MDETLDCWLEDQRAKRLAARRPSATAKVRPTALRLPSDLEQKRQQAWWRTAPPVVKVDIVTGEVLVWRWPVQPREVPQR